MPKARPWLYLYKAQKNCAFITQKRRLLADPANLPWNADISVGDLRFELNVTAIRDASGDYIGNSLEWQDVTELRQRQIQVGRLNSAIEGMTANLMMADLDGNIVYMNPAVERMSPRREVQLREAMPDFSVDRLVGTNFDSFHKKSGSSAQPVEQSFCAQTARNAGGI